MLQLATNSIRSHRDFFAWKPFKLVTFKVSDDARTITFETSSIKGGHIEPSKADSVKCHYPLCY